MNAPAEPPSPSGPAPRAFTRGPIPGVVAALGGLAFLVWLGHGSLAVLFTLLYAAIALLPYGADPRRRPTLDPFDPYPGLALLLYLYSVSPIYIVEDSGFTYYQEFIPIAALERYALACLLGLLGLVVGTLAFRRREAEGAPEPAAGDDGPRRILTRGMLVLALLLLPFYADRFNFLHVVSYAEAAFASRLDRMADTAGGLKQVFLRDFPTTVVLCWATVGLLDRKSAPVRRVLAALVLGAFILTTLLSGWRGQLFTAALLPIVYFHYRVRRLRLGEVALAGVGAYILVNALSVMRLTSNISEMVGLLNAEAADRGMTFLKLSQSGELATSSNLLRLIVGIQDGETHYMWGGLLGSQLGSVVPRAFWLDRPPLGNELFVQVFYPGVYESGGGFAFFILQDGYWDFGLPGVVLYSAVFALGLRWLYDQLVVRRRGALWPLLYAVLFGQLVLSSVRTGLLASVKEASMAALPLLTVWFIDAVARARRKLEQAGT